jgi:hypothetical protein
VVEPVHPLKGRQLELLDVVPTRSVGPIHTLGLVDAVNGFSERVVIRIDNRPNGRSGSDLGQAFSEPH